ncbi:MAG: endonuclease/exonuclease/phosphatase family protein [Candidatus Obscuribacterales bacterium]|nr:endonuclease/exonuclease/phosphatase family protein [Candidatus Obscuribacterales bacterium]
MLKIGHYLTRLAHKSFWVLSSLVFASYSLSNFWPFNLFSHFPIQWISLFSVGLGWFIFKRNYLRAVACVALIAMNTLQMLPYMKAADHAQASSIAGTKIRLMQMNIFVGNRNLNKAAEFIKSQSPDVLAIEEFNEKSLAKLKNLHCLDEYPTMLMVPNYGPGSQVALFSKLPAVESRAEYSQEHVRPCLKMRFILNDGKELDVVAMHPAPPALPLFVNRQIDQFKCVSSLLPKLGKNVVVMGDFNSTPWANPFKDFIKESGLQDPRIGRGLMPSWPSIFPPLFIPIDYILVSKGITVKDYSVGSPVGSDHLPLVMDIEI